MLTTFATYSGYKNRGITSVLALDYAVSMGARIVTNSWGGPNKMRSLHDAVINAYRRDVLVVASAGSSSVLGSHPLPYYPATYNLPSEDIHSLWKDGGYMSISDASVSSPFVAGVAALILSIKPTFGYAYMYLYVHIYMYGYMHIHMLGYMHIHMLGYMHMCIC
eukprot:GHVQ01030074.1.p1 GENE.GHVQ01030074.1~~GHVQ01030074.1.p1  ORF type:complete len:164 (+),score=9.50 GHVQ01030074.1:341-832(+)